MPAPLHSFLMARTAEMLAIPHMACFRRDCRRTNRCRWAFNGTREPCCLRNLDDHQRRIFDEFFNQALIILEHGGHHGLTYAWGDEETRALLDACVEIARTAVRPHDKRRFAAFRRDREKIPAPPARQKTK